MDLIGCKFIVIQGDYSGLKDEIEPEGHTVHGLARPRDETI
jgi:hypothetical protein